MHLKFHFKFFVVLCFFASAHSGFFSRNEYIKLFESDITVQQDGIIKVIEHITVKAAQDKIKRGIFRSIPTDYKNYLGTLFVDLKVFKVLLNNKSVKYTIEKALNGNIIKIGDPSILLSPGVYQYTIEYTLSRQLGFFDVLGRSWAELYFNIVGNGWPFYIEKIRARIHLPPTIPSKDIQFEAYTGLFGEQGKNYKAFIDSADNTVIIESHGLNQFEGLTASIMWPRGFVAEPSTWQKIVYFLTDFFWLIWYVLGFIFLLVFYLFAYNKEKNKLKELTVIPLFRPPVDLTPGAVRYINKKGFDNTCFAADIVDMGVHGFLEIEEKKGWLSSKYELKKKELGATETTAISSNRMHFYNTFHKNLFSKQATVLLGKSMNTVVRKAVDQAETAYSVHYSGDYFNFNAEYIVIGILISIFDICIPFLFNLNLGRGPLTFIALAAYACINFMFYHLLKMYTPAGAKVANEIMGFIMYLETAESERLKFLSTPPVKTPELYETLLPYAIALGVEEAWSKQFVPIFNQLEAQGITYRPTWFHGNISAFKPRTFATQLNTGLNSSISSSVRAPGSSSGSSGRGSSGGGGGGGGGGGW